MQIKKNGKPTDFHKVIPDKLQKLTNCCSICGDTQSVKYYIWHQEGEYQNKELCNKHYNQLIRHGCPLKI